MTDGNHELKQLRRPALASIHPSGLVVLGTLCMALLLVVLAACGDGDGAVENGGTQAAPQTGAAETRGTGGEGASPSATSTSQAEPTPARTDGSESVYDSLLGVIPVIPDSPRTPRAVYINDYDVVRRMFDIPLPGPGDDDDALEAFYDWSPSSSRGTPTPALVGHVGLFSFGSISFLGWYSQRTYMQDNLQYLALDIRNVSQTLVVNPNLQQEPPIEWLTSMDVVRGSFDPRAADRALEACAECPPHNREEHRGVSWYSWGEDYEAEFGMKYSPPAYDKYGIGGRIAVLDDYVFRTTGSPEMEAIIDSKLNKAPSLADVEEWRLLADGMSRLGAYTMLLTDGSGAYDKSVEGIYTRWYSDVVLTQSEMEEQKRILAETGGPLLRPFDGYATGAGIDEDGHYLALALVHTNTASAEENVELLRRRIEEGGGYFSGPESWSSAVDIDSSEIRSEGRMLLAKLSVDSEYRVALPEHTIFLMHE